MSLTTTKTKCAAQCTRCRFERVWPQGFHGTFVGVDALREWLAASWGWTFKKGDMCRDCSKVAA